MKKPTTRTKPDSPPGQTPDPPPPETSFMPTVAIVAVPGVVEAIDRLTAVVSGDDPGEVPPMPTPPDYTKILATITAAIVQQTTAMVTAMNANTAAILTIAEKLTKPTQPKADTITLTTEIE